MTRRALDFYETADWQVDALVDHVPEIGGLVWCPCVGDGSLMDRLWRRLPGLRFVTSDIDDKRWADFCGDATQEEHWIRMLNESGARPDWVIENFPFSVEHLILPHALSVARCGVAAMARVSYAEPTAARGPWLKANPYQKRITLERHSFSGDGSTDSTTTDWLVWATVPLAGPFGISAHGYRPAADKRRAERAERTGAGRGARAGDPAVGGDPGHDADGGVPAFAVDEF